MAQANLSAITSRMMAGGMPPWLRQLVLLLGVAGAVAFGLAVVLWSREPDYRVLYSNLPPERASAVMDALTAQNIAFKLEDNTGALLVPESELHNARLKLAGSGLTQTEDGSGLEMIRAEKGFGVSEFMETRKYQHALEVELARTIESIQQIRSARVHLALPKQSVFVRDRKPASASVMVDIRPGSSLDQKNVTAIMNLVASSIPELSADQVTVVDQQGELLSKVDRDDALELSNRQFAYRQQVEQAYEERIEHLLSAIVPSGRVRVQVSTDMDFSSMQESRETYNPERAVVRSEQINNSRNENGGDKAAGVPGALSNQPPADASPAPGAAVSKTAAANGSSTEAITRNYEIDRVLNYSSTPAGNIRKLSVAVVVDSTPLHGKDGSIVKPGPNAVELERMNGLVQGAIGYQPERGDKVTVVSASFAAPVESAEADEGVAIWQQPWFASLVKQVLVGLAILLVALGVLRPLLRQTLLPALPAGIQPGQDGALALAGEGASALAQLGYAQPNGLPAPVAAAPLALPGNDLEQRMSAVRNAAAEDPRLVAQVVKSWVTPHDA